MAPADQARLARLVLYAYGDAPLDPEWEVVDRLVSPIDPEPFGLLAADKSGFVTVAIRGTVSPIEWFKDSQAAFTSSPIGAGRTEQGFTSIYRSLTWQSGSSPGEIDAVAGHSLGGPLATYLGLHSTLNTGHAPELLVIESPAPGDAEFVTYASPLFASITRWENPHDVVPDLPGRILGYRDLIAPVTTIDTTPLGIGIFDLAGNHSLANCLKAFCAANDLA